MARVEDIATYNLILQVVILALISYGIWTKFKGRLQRHGRIITLAYALLILAVLFAMLPRFIGGLAQPAFTYTLPDQLRWVHVTLGVCTVVLGAFLVARFVRGGLTPKYCKGKRLMLTTASFWVATLLLGAFIYYLRATA